MTPTRRERERASVHDRIVTVALDVLQSEGPAAMTVRRIASEVEYTAPVVYQHFANKDALLMALVELGFADLHQRMAEAAHDTEPEEALYRSGRAYLGFAADSGHLYQLMNAATLDPVARQRAAAPVIELVIHQIRQWAGHHRVELSDPAANCEIIWGTLHGLASLGQIGTVGATRATELADLALHALFRAWRSA